MVIGGWMGACLKDILKILFDISLKISLAKPNDISIL